MRKLLTSLIFLIVCSPAYSQTFTPVPFIFVFGQPANASQVMANFQSIVNNGNAAANLINSSIAAVTPPPSGAFLFFNLTACPTGWTIWTPPAGAPSTATVSFVRGLDLGRGMDTTQTAILGFEASVMQDHTHATGQAVTALGQTAAVTPNGNNPLTNATGSFVTNPFTGAPTSAAGSEARPKNVSLLLCSKN